MKKAIFGLALAATLSAAPAGAVISTSQYSALIVMGDSLVDAGNISTLTGGANPPSALGYFNGRFTNGWDYTDLLSINLFGTPTTASLQGGSNFAFGGARATSTSSGPVQDLAAQMNMYRNYIGIDAGFTADPNALVVLNFGGNDLFNVPGQITTAATNIANAVQTLNNWGARNILVTGFPPVGTDFGAVMLGETTLLTQLAGLSLDSDTTLMNFSYINFFQTVLSNPGALGLPTGLNMNPAQNCVAAGAQATGCAGYFYFDSVHPTAQVQAAAFRSMNAQFNLTAVPEPGTWAMMIAGFGFVGAAMRRRQTKTAVRFAIAA